MDPGKTILAEQSLFLALAGIRRPSESPAAGVATFRDGRITSASANGSSARMVRNGAGSNDLTQECDRPL